MKVIQPYALKFKNIALCFIAALIFNSSPLKGQSFKVFAISDLGQVFEDGYKLPQQYDTVKLFGIRGEVISGQFAINAFKDLEDLTINLSSLKNKETGSTLPDYSVQWNFVGSVPLIKNTPNQPLDVLSRKAPARYPEYLRSEKQIKIKAKTYQAVWLTLTIPEKGEPGIFLGQAIIKSGKEERSIPINVTVFPLNLPAARHLKVIEWHNTDDFEKFHGIKDKYSKEWFEMLGKYAENMVLHRQNIFQVPVDHIKIIRTDLNKFEFDFTFFDKVAKTFWDTKKMDMLETGFLANFGTGDWFSTEVLLKDFKVIDSKSGEVVTIKGQEVAPSLITALESHLRQMGWLEKTLFHVRDEPSVHNALAWKDMSDYVHRYGPDLIRGDAIETTFLLDDIEIAIPKLDHFATWNESYSDWAKKGNEVWFYTVGIYQGSRFPNKTIDMPLIDSRLMHWLNYKYEATGYLHWGYNQWDDDPFNRIGDHIGDAWLVYPAKDGVINSLRWEEMRNGIQDYEYFWMLEDNIKTLKDSLGTRFSWIKPNQRGKEIAGQVIKTFSDRSNDPVTVEKAKKNLIKELLDFNTSPRIYVQTNPLEGTSMTMNSSVEVFGWTEPGTKIVVNGKELPVSKQGLFVEQFEVTLQNNLIVVKATGSKGSKDILRSFIVY
jgi:hypothetical protein